MNTLIWAGLAAPLGILLLLATMRLIQHESGFGPVALTAAGVYVMAAAPVCAWLNARGFSARRVPGYAFGFLAMFGVSLAVRGLGLMRGPGASIAMIVGSGALGAAALTCLRRRRTSGGDLVPAPGTETASGDQRSTTLPAESGRLE